MRRAVERVKDEFKSPDGTDMPARKKPKPKPRNPWIPDEEAELERAANRGQDIEAARKEKLSQAGKDLEAKLGDPGDKVSRLPSEDPKRQRRDAKAGEKMDRKLDKPGAEAKRSARAQRDARRRKKLEKKGAKIQTKFDKGAQKRHKKAWQAAQKAKEWADYKATRPMVGKVWDFLTWPFRKLANGFSFIKKMLGRALWPLMAGASIVMLLSFVETCLAADVADPDFDKKWADLRRAIIDTIPIASELQALVTTATDVYTTLHAADYAQYRGATVSYDEDEIEINPDPEETEIAGEMILFPRDDVRKRENLYTGKKVDVDGEIYVLKVVVVPPGVERQDLKQFAINWYKQNGLPVPSDLGAYNFEPAGEE